MIKKQADQNLLILTQVPPPYHGASIMNQYLLNILYESQTKYIHLPIVASKTISSIGLFSISKVLSSISIAVKIAKKRKLFDTLYLVMSVTTIAFYRDVLFVLIAKLLRKRVIIHCMGLGFREKHGFSKLLASAVFNRSYAIQHSKLLSYDLEHYTPRKKFVLPNGIPDSFTWTKTKTKKRAGVQIVFLSNLMEAKGLFVLLRALTVVRNENIRVHFIGNYESDSVKKEFIAYIRENGLEDVVGEIGPKYNSQKFDFLAEMDLMVFPTLNESFGNVILEGMMFSLPVIASNEGSIPDIIDDGETGFIVEKYNWKKIAEKIDYLVENPQARSIMGQKARERYRKLFTLKKYEENILNIFKTVRSDEKS